jgi:hypothetical protein
MDTPDISVDETTAAALRGVSTDTQRRHRRQNIGPRAFRAEGAKGFRYRLRDIQAEQQAPAGETPHPANI